MNQSPSRITAFVADLGHGSVEIYIMYWKLVHVVSPVIHWNVTMIKENITSTIANRSNHLSST